MAKIYATEDLYEPNVIKVYLTNDQYNADLWFYRTDNEADAQNEDAVWYMTDDKYNATACICWVDNEYDADIVAYKINYRGDAGWNKGNKFISRLS